MEATKFILEKFSNAGVPFLLLIIVLYGVYKIIMKLLDVIEKSDSFSKRDEKK